MRNPTTEDIVTEARNFFSLIGMAVFLARGCARRKLQKSMG
ncbi:hypothetical protein D1AOALGA4SA_4468 [Olavius algarvensis Delta 1 endosymbiont]|nr:hypothetical protein D1AOALGA4SA_4468 [Olavius algarvensis Delta 1 endosymbiont]